MYIKKLHEAHIEYCKSYWLKPLSKSGFYKRAEEFLKEKNFFTEPHKWQWGNRVRWETKKEKRVKYMKETWEVVSYPAYCSRINYWRKKQNSKLLEYNLHKIINWDYSIHRYRMSNRLWRAKRNWLKIEDMIFNPIKLWTKKGKIQYVLEKEISQANLPVIEYLELRKTCIKLIQDYFINKDDKILSELEKIGKILQTKFYKNIY